MILYGTYDRICMQYQENKIENLKLKQRKMFRISNPLLVPEMPFDDKRLWFDLETYQVSPANESRK